MQELLQILVNLISSPTMKEIKIRKEKENKLNVEYFNTSNTMIKLLLEIKIKEEKNGN